MTRCFIFGLAFLFSIFCRLFSYELSICAIFQDEAPYLKEWIEYHQLLGVEHFYLYNDRSSDHYLEVLTPYINKKVVELTDCHAKNGERHFFNQRRAYVRGLKKAKFESKWVAIIDIDEFIVPKETDSITKMLSPYEEYFGIVIRWKKFGTSGYWEIPNDKLMIECLTRTSPTDDEDNFVTKSIIQPLLLPEYFFDEDYVIQHQIDLVHFCKWVSNGERKSKNCGPISFPSYSQKVIPLAEAQINHYWCKDERFYRGKKADRKARLQAEDFNTPYPWSEEKIQKYLNLYNLSIDYEIQRFVPVLQERMALLENPLRIREHLE